MANLWRGATAQGTGSGLSGAAGGFLAPPPKGNPCSEVV